MEREGDVSTTNEPVRYDVADSVGTITFNRPDCGNAWSPELRECYLDRVDEVRRDPSVRVVVITGAGRSFCVGADLAAVAGGNFAAADQPRSVSALYDLHKPVIAAINGGCAGMGLVQALQADVRFASDSAKITTSFARRGLAAEFGASWLLPRVVGVGAAMDLLLSARVVTGTEAVRLGLVNVALPSGELFPAVYRYARDLAENCSPASMAVIKAQVRHDTDASLADSMAAASRLAQASLQEPDAAEGARSFLDRRPPRFAAIGERVPWIEEAMGS